MEQQLTTYEVMAKNWPSLSDRKKYDDFVTEIIYYTKRGTKVLERKKKGPKNGATTKKKAPSKK